MFIVQLILFQIFILTALILAIKYFISKNVTAATSHLQNLTEDYIKKEGVLKDKYSETEKKYEETIEIAKNKSDEIIRRAKELAKKESVKIIEDARINSEEIVKRGKKCSDEIKKEINEHITKEAIIKARELINALLTEDIKRTLHQKSVKELLAKGITALASRMKIPESIKSITVESAFKLSPQETAALKREIKKIIKKDTGIEEKVIPGIIAGVIIKIGSVELDGSLSSRIKKITDEKNETGK